MTALKDTTLKDKVALVTGGSRGIGAAVAKRLAQEGAAVVITYSVSRQAAEAVVRDIEAEGGRALAIQADSADIDAVKAAVARTVKTSSAGVGSTCPAQSRARTENRCGPAASSGTRNDCPGHASNFDHSPSS